MKTKIIILLALLVHTLIFAQQGINYKAVIKDDLGNIISNTDVVVQFIIYEGEALTNEVYAEQHAYTTDANGFVILNIGDGNTVDDFNTINWGSDEHFINVQVNIDGGGLIDVGTSQFMNVPYALHANTSNSVIKLPEPYILGRSTQTSNGRFQFNGKYGWQAAQDMCETSYPNDPNVRAFTLEQISQALILGNWDTNNLNSINGISFWAITPISYTTTNNAYPTAQQNNLYGLNVSGTGTSVGTSGQIIINATSIPSESNADNPFNTYLRVTNTVSSGFVYPCMCGTYN